MPRALPSLLPAAMSAVLLTLLGANQARADTWRSIPDDSRLEFVASYEGAEAPGKFSRFEVELDRDPDNGTPNSLRVDVDVTSASMGNPDIDEAISEPEWFDMKAFPNATFRSEQITLKSGHRYIAAGVVSIKGVNQPLSIPFEWNPMGQKGEMKGAVTLARVDFDIGSGEWASDSSIGHEVLVRFTISLQPEK